MAVPIIFMKSNTEIKPWSKNYPQCVVCGGTERAHSSKGLCTRCYMRGRNSKSTVVTDWDKKAVPIECAHCMMMFEENELRTETEDSNGYRIDYHPDCWIELLNHE